MSAALLGAARSSDSLAALTFIDIAIIVVLARLAGNAMRWFRQPAVIGEIIVGILLGPTLLGAFPGHLTTHLFPLDVRPYLSDIAQIGLVIFMFLVGLEVDAKLLRGRARLAATVSLSSIAVPFGLGIAIAFSLHGSHHLVPNPTHLTQIRNVHLLPFALFIGASMSVTAFPVLARILAERGLYRIPVGAITLACAAVDDVAAWTLLAVVLAVVSGGGAGHVVLVMVEAAAFFAGIMIVVRPLLRWAVTHFHRDEGLAPELMVIVLAGILASSYVTAEIGIHQIFGAFIFGVAMPRDGTAKFVSEVVERLESVALILLLPVYFVVTGFSVNVRTISASGVGQLGLILVAAIGGKFLGATFGARINGLPGRRAATVGVLMNTRGLTELVILNVGLSKGVLDMQLFTLLVVMAIVTTVMTEPLLRLVYPDRLLAADVADVERQDAGRGGYRVLVYVGDLAADVPILGMAASMFARESEERVNVSHFVVRRKHRVSGMAGDLAEMADLLDQLGRLCRAEGGDRLHAGALFTDDIERELRDQVARLDIDCLVVGPGAPEALVSSLLAAPPADVLFARRLPATTAQVVAMAEEGDDAPAVVEVAARLAIARGLPLVLVAASRGGQRRLGQCAERFRTLLPAGVQVAAALDSEHSTDPGTLVVSGAEMADAPVRVRSGEDAARIGWEERVTRVMTLRPASTGASS